MQSLRLKVSVRDHRIAAELPPEVPDGEAEMIIYYKGAGSAALLQARHKYLQDLLERNRRRSPGRSREDIDRQVAEERAAWGE